MKKNKTWHEVLRCYMKRQDSNYIKKYFDICRAEKGFPLNRCDNEHCVFNKQTLEWCNLSGANEQLPVILDHINGNNSDNRPDNLRYLCPNCDSLLSNTRGGANKGRIKRYDENNYAVIERKGPQHYYLFGSGGAVAGGSAKISFKKAKNNREPRAEPRR